jgi:hypothetical protein
MSNTKLTRTWLQVDRGIRRIRPLEVFMLFTWTLEGFKGSGARFKDSHPSEYPPDQLAVGGAEIVYLDFGRFRRIWDSFKNTQ